MSGKVKPTGGKVYSDEHDEKGGDLFEQYIKTRDPKLLLEAETEYVLSTNPERDKIATLVKGLYYREQGKREKDHVKARKFLLKAMTLIRNVDGDEKIAKEVELEFLKRKLRSKENHKENVDEKIFMRSANLHKELGHEKAYNLEMSLYHLFFLTKHMDTLPTFELLENAEKMLKHAQKGEEPEQLHKTKALYHQIKAKHSRNSKEALRQWEEAVNEVKQTSDRFGYDKTETEYMMAKAMSTVNPEQRNKILEKVADRYQKGGDKQKEDFVRKLLSPLPIKASQVIYLADQSTERLRILEKEINNIKGEEKGPFAVFYHLGYMLERIEDVKRILLRMAVNRKELTQLHIQEEALRPVNLSAGKPYPKKLQQVLRRSDGIRKQMRQDMESLLIYGNLLLDQWSYLIGYLAGYRVPEKQSMPSSYYFKLLSKLFPDENTKKELKIFWENHKKEAHPPEPELNFMGLIQLLQNKKYKGELLEFWSKHKKEIIWLNFHLRFFRNVFIEHLRKPWQRGDTMGVYGDDFNLHIPAAVGYIKPEDEKKILKEIYPISPKRLRDMPDDYWEKKNLRRVLEVTLYYIDELEKQSDRDKVWRAWHTLGGSSPSYDTIGYRLFTYLYESLETITDFLKKNPELLKLGKFQN